MIVRLAVDNVVEVPSWVIQHLYSSFLEIMRKKADVQIHIVSCSRENGQPYGACAARPFSKNNLECLRVVREINGSTKYQKYVR